MLDDWADSVRGGTGVTLHLSHSILGYISDILPSNTEKLDGLDT